jgi:hypothetical protein
MPTIKTKTIILALFILLFSNYLKAQPRVGQFINASIGLGISAVNDSNDDLTASGSGFYAQGEYVMGLTKWFGFRPYAGFVITDVSESDIKQNQPLYIATSKALLVGGKVRLAAPIPYVAPYIEVGIGTSFGTFKTFTPNTHIEKKGVVAHIPFSLGLSLGKKHSVDFAFTYYFHQSVNQFSGAAALGFTFPIDK